MNTKLWAKFRAAARRSASFTETKDRFGQNITTYDDIPLIDLGAKPGSNNPIVGINATTGVSPLYAVRLGMDGFHEKVVELQLSIRRAGTFVAGQEIYIPIGVV